MDSGPTSNGGSTRPWSGTGASSASGCAGCGAATGPRAAGSKPPSPARAPPARPAPPGFRPPSSLPTFRSRRKRLAIAAAVERHPVVVVRGETGSGKTTQLPKICLAAGRGAAGWIGHTQAAADRGAKRGRPHRARAERGGWGRRSGPRSRFRDEVGPDTYVKVMTDGILVAEIGKDRLLEAYDTLIILDEAHERSLKHRPAARPREGGARASSRPPGDRPAPRRSTRSASRTSSGTLRSSTYREERTRSRFATVEAGSAPEGPGRGGAGGRSGRSRGKGRATSSSSCPASATSGRRPGPFARTVRSRCCPSTRASTTPSRDGSSAPASGGGWCWRRTSRRPSLTVPASGSWSTPGSPASAGTAIAPGSSASPSRPVSRASAEQRRGAVRADRAGHVRAALLAGGLRGPAAIPPRPRSGARTSRP